MRFLRMSKLEPENIFNPRGEYDERMYISRPEYERQFKHALRNDMCVLVHGQSGTGKTWLTRRVLIKEDYYFKPVNLATASTFKSIYSCFKNIMIRENWQIRTKYQETKKANVKIAVADGGISNTSEYTTEVDFFMEFLKFMQYRTRNKSKKRYIVFENFESIIDNEVLLKELTNLITLIDDDEVLKFNTKFIIVAATSDIQKYFKSVTNVNTIENRVMELPEIKTLTTLQSFELVERGFKELDIDFSESSLLDKYKKHVAWITGGVPQRLHEYCLELSLLCKENNWEAKKEFLDKATKTWIATSLNKNYACIKKELSFDKTKISRKNQIFYCLGLKEKEKFSSNEICQDMYQEFPNTTNGKKLNTTKVLNEMCTATPPILSKDEVSKEFSFVDNKYALCLRSMLYKDPNEIVGLYDFDDI